MAWSWLPALHGATTALPAATLALHRPDWGLALAVGVMPAVFAGLPGARRSS